MSLYQRLNNLWRLSGIELLNEGVTMISKQDIINVWSKLHPSKKATIVEPTLLEELENNNV